jgi:hydroxyethylthiazole kinase-like uncharacterized protein yjeF
LQLDSDGLSTAPQPTATLIGTPTRRARLHASHKGSYGDVAVVGGAPGMAGAAQLAATAALFGGAGRVLLCSLDTDATAQAGVAFAPELMRRDVEAIDPRRMTVVGGCGGGDRIHAVLPRLLAQALHLVLDADALNAVAHDMSLRQLLRARAARNAATVLTPHPLEAARLLGADVKQVQSNRLHAAMQIALDCQCTVVLKGSGSIVAAPGQTPAINPTGNARLAVPGSGDVLAGMIGAALAGGAAPFDSACQAVYRHGAAADQWPAGEHLTASALARRAGDVVPSGTSG